MLIKDAAEFLQSRIDKKGLTGKIEEQSFIGDEAGAGYLMEEAYDKKEKKMQKAWTKECSRWNSEFN